MRFEGIDGARRARHVLENSDLFHGLAPAIDRALAEGEIETFSKDALVISEGAYDNDIFVLLSGEVEVGVRGRFGKRRGPGSNVGEMSVIDPSHPRSAAIRACTDVVALRLSETAFSELAEEYSALWRRLAWQLAHRLRERLADVYPKREKPVVFIGCSIESIPYAEALQVRLQHECSGQIWTDGVFTPSSNTSTAVIDAIHAADFCILIATADDLTIARETEHPVPRDNVVLELGIGLGSLGQERTFFATPSNTNMRLPSDLSGVTPARLDMSAETPEQTVGPVASSILPRIRTMGPK